MEIRQNTGPERILLRQRNLPARRTDLVRWHMGRPSSPDPLRNAGYELGTGRLPLRGGPLGQRLLRLERRRQAKERGYARSERRGRVPEPDLVLLLDWLRETANVYTGGTNTNARAANGDTATHSLSPANGDTDGSSNCDGDSYLDAHFSGYEYSHSSTVGERLTYTIPEHSASQGRAHVCPEAGAFWYEDAQLRAKLPVYGCRWLTPAIVEGSM